MYDPDLYRDKAEIERWRHRDPLVVLGDRMRDEGVLADDDLARLEQQVADEVDAAVAFADAGHEEPVSELTRFVHTERPEGVR
jgi:TPP-dependent pyruvate/acetoin dehydrogenase alpha subunit